MTFLCLLLIWCKLNVFLCIFIISLQRCVFINKSQNPRLFMHDNIQLFKWTEQVLVGTYFNQALVFFFIQSCISQLTQDKAICTCSSGLLKFFHYFYLCFFQDAACKRPLWTEDHFSHCSFVCWEDSAWVGVGINNRIQGAVGGGGGGGTQEKFG